MHATHALTITNNKQIEHWTGPAVRQWMQWPVDLWQVGLSMLATTRSTTAPSLICTVRACWYVHYTGAARWTQQAFGQGQRMDADEWMGSAEPS
jgi:hypothetical protein